AGLHGLPEVDAGQAPAGGRRRVHPRATVLHRLGTVPRRRDPPRAAEAHDPDRPAPHRQLPGHRPALEPPRVPGRMELPGRRADGPPRGKALRGVVADAIEVRAARPEDVPGAARLAARLVREHHAYDPLRFMSLEPI